MWEVLQPTSLRQGLIHGVQKQSKKWSFVIEDADDRHLSSPK